MVGLVNQVSGLFFKYDCSLSSVSAEIEGVFFPAPS